MQWVIRFFLGSVRVKIFCAFPERVLNICAVNSIEFADIEYNDNGELHITVDRKAYRRLTDIAEASGVFSVSMEAKYGLPDFLWGLRKRWALFAGMAACIILLGASSLFIWQIDVSGNESVSSSKILAALKDLGVSVGTCRLTVSQEYISNEMLQKIPELSWITVNTKGSRADVMVREEIPAPEIEDRDQPTEVIALKAGIIKDILVLQGIKNVAQSDTVLPGDVLIRSEMENLYDAPRYVHADGEVWASTWYTFSSSMPLDTLRKCYTGRTQKNKAIILGGKRINLYLSSGNPWECYDKITKYKPLHLPDGTVLPLTVVSETVSEYESLPYVLPEETAMQILKAGLTERLADAVEQGSVVSSEFTAESDGSILTVTLRAECLEQIGIKRELSRQDAGL